MKKLLLLAVSVILLSLGCNTQPEVMARFVPERADDFVWENDLVAFRAYGAALENELISPGFDVWVKTGGKLVADEWYKGSKEGLSYHVNRGDGMDCYKVGKTLGGGGSSPIVNGEFYFPANNYSSYEILASSPKEISFVLNYPEWDVAGIMLKLSKNITIKAGTNFFKVVDTYTGDFQHLDVAAGVIRHEVLAETSGDNYFAIYEQASDTKNPVEAGNIGLAIFMLMADKIDLNGPSNHAVAIRNISPGDKVEYYVGSAWSQGNAQTSKDWMTMVEEFVKNNEY